MIAFKTTMTGGRATVHALEHLRGSELNAALRSGLRKVGSVMSKAAKEIVETESRTLKLSLGYKVFSKYRRMGVVIGPRRGFAAPVRQANARKKGTRGKIRRMAKRQLLAGVRPDRIRDPVKYAHLVEKGRKAVAAVKKRILLDESGDVLGRQVAKADARPFLRPTYDRNKELALDIVQSEIRAAVQKTLRS